MKDPVEVKSALKPFQCTGDDLKARNSFGPGYLKDHLLNAAAHVENTSI